MDADNSLSMLYGERIEDDEEFEMTAEEQAMEEQDEALEEDMEKEDEEGAEAADGGATAATSAAAAAAASTPTASAVLNPAITHPGSVGRKEGAVDPAKVHPASN